MRDLKITSHKCSIFLSRHEGSIFLMKGIWIDNKLQIRYKWSNAFFQFSFNVEVATEWAFKLYTQVSS
jgi:hypothetical protein